MNTIVIIEDDNGINELISLKVNECGYETISFYNGEDALAYLGTNNNALLVLDYGLPDMSGKEFITKLLELKISSPFIVSTGQGDERIAVEMMKLGAKDYIIKDINFLELLPSIITRVAKEIENENRLKLAEMELKESERRFSLFMDHLPSAVFLKDSNGKTLYVNKYMDETLGASQWIGKTIAEVLPNEIGSKMLEDDIAIFEKKYIKTVERVFHNNNEKHTYETQKFIIPQIGKEPLIGGIGIDITERKTLEDVGKFLITCGLSRSGHDFFESLAQYLSETLDMEYVCIDTLDGDGLTAHTLAIYNDGAYDTNVSYTLKQTPCGEVVGKTICCFPENVCNLFPNDRALLDLNAESYVGTTLWSFDGKPIGLIAVIGRKPLKNPSLAENILRLVSVRASGELERKKGEEALLKKIDELNYLNKFMVNRELRMADMKKEINELLKSAGKEKRYL